MELYYFPLGRHSQKVLIALYEKQVNFYPRVTDLRDPEVRQLYLKLCSQGRLPLLKTHSGSLLPESSIIIDYLDNRFDSGSRLLPINHEEELQVRLFDRLIDNELNQTLNLRDAQSDQVTMRRLESQLTDLLLQLDRQLNDNHWICGDSFSLADCALLPCLRHHWVRSQLREMPNLSRYWHQGNLRGSWGLVQEEIELAETEEHTGLSRFKK